MQKNNSLKKFFVFFLTFLTVASSFPFPTANAVSGDVILLWDGAEIPSGWTCISCVSGDAFFEVFPRATATYGGTGGGPETGVTHTISFGSGTGNSGAAVNITTVDTVSGASVSAQSHIHTAPANLTSGSATITPEYRNLKFIMSNDPISLPAGVIGMFDTASLPTGWTAYGDMNDDSGVQRYLRGGGSIATGGTAIHDHTRAGSGFTGAAGTSSRANTLAGANIPAVANTHNHTIASGTGPSADNLPSYATVVFAKLTVDNDAPPDGLIAMFNNTTMPLGWTIISGVGSSYENKLIRGTSTCSPSCPQTGGSATHNHSSQILTTNASSTLLVTTLLTGVAPGGHTHDYTATHSTTNLMPAYRDVILGKLKAITISGTVYSGEGTGALTGKAIKGVVSGIAIRNATTDGSGNYSLVVPDPGVGSNITVWLNGEAEKGATVTKSGGGDVSGIDIYQNHLILRHEDSGPITNSNIGICDKITGSACGTTDLFFDEASGVLTADAGVKIFIWTGDTFTPGGNVSSPEIKVVGTLSAGANIITLTGSGTPFVITGTFTPSTSTVKYTSTSATNITATTYNNLESVPAGTITHTLGTGISQTITVNGTFTVGNGTNTVTVTATTWNPTLNITGATTIASGATYTTGTGTQTFTGAITVTGTISGSANGTVVANNNVTGAGVINLTGGTFEQRVSANRDFGTTSGSNNWIFNNLTFSRGGGTPTITTQTGGSGTITVNGALLIGKSGDGAATTLNAGNRTWILTNSGTPFVVLSSPAGVLTPSTSTFKYTSTSATNITSTTYYNLESSPAGTVTHTLGTGASQTITVSNNLTIGNGTNAVTVTGNTNNPILDIAGDVTILANAIFIAPPSSSFTVGGSWTNSGTFTHNSGTITFDSTLTGKTITSGGSAFYNLTFNGSGGAWALQDTHTIANDFTITNGTVTAPSSIIVTGSWSNSGTFTHNSGTVTFNAGTTGKTVTSGGSSFNNLTFNGGGGGWTLQDNHTIISVLNITAGTLNASSRTITLSGNGTPFVVSGTFTPSTSTVNYAPSGTTGVTVASTTYHHVTFNKTSNTFSLTTGGITTQNGGNLTITAGTLDTVSGQNYPITVGGNWSNSGTFTANSGTVTMSSTSTGRTISGTISGASSFYNLTFNGSGGSWTFGGNPTITNVLNITTGTLDATTRTITLSGNGTPFVVSGTFTPSTSTVNYAPSGTTGVIVASTTYHHVTFNKASNTFSLTTGGITTQNGGNLTITAGTLDTVSGQNYPITVGGNWSNSGTFTANSGTVTFTTNTANKTLSGTMTGGSAFYNLTFNQSSRTWTLNADLDVSNILTITAGTLSASSRTITLSGSGTPLVVSGAITPGTSTFKYTSTSATNITSTTYYNLESSPAGTVTHTLGTGASQTITVSNNLTIGNGTNAVTVTGNTNNPILDIAGDVTILANAIFIAPPSSSFTVGGSWTNSGTFTHNSGTITFDSTATGETITSGGSLFNELVMNGSGGEWTLQDATTLAGSLKMTAGTLKGSVNLTVEGGYIDCGVTCGTITFTTAGTTTIEGTGDLGTTGLSPTWTFFNLTLGDGTVDATTAKGGGTISANALTISTNQTFNSGAKTYQLTGSGTPLVRNGTFNEDTSTISFENNTSASVSAITYYNLRFRPSAGTPTYTLLSGALVVSNNIEITNNGAGTPTVTANANDPSIDLANDFTLTIGTFIAPPSASFTVGGSWSNSATFTHNSGTVTFDSTATGKTITSGGSSFNNLTFNGTGGGWTLSDNITVISVMNVAVGTLNASSRTIILSGTGTPLVIAGTFNQDSSTVSYENNTSANVTTRTYYNLRFRPSAGTPTYTLLTGALAVTNNLEITNNGAGAPTITANTNNPSIALTNNFTLTIGTFIAPPSASFTVGGSWTNSGTFTHNSGTVTFNATTTGKTITSGGSLFNELIMNGSGGEWTLQDATTLAGSLKMTAGTLKGAVNLTVRGGYIDCGVTCGTITFTAGTTTIEGTGDLGTTGLSPTWTFFNLTLGDGTVDATTAKGGGTIIAEVMTIATNQTFNSGTKTYQLNGSGTAFVINGTFVSDTSTVSFEDNTSVNVVASTYYNLRFRPSSGTPTYTLLAGSLVVNNDMTITNNGAGTPTVNANTNDPSIDIANDFTISVGTFVASFSAGFNIAGSWSNSGTFTHSSGTITFDATASGETITSGGSSFFNLTFNGSGGGWTLQDNHTITSVLTITAGNLDASTRTITLSGNGTPLVVSGTFTPNTSTVKYTGTSATNITSTTYYNLESSPAGTVTHTLGTGASQTITVNNNLTIGNGTNAVTLTGNTNDPTVTVTGNLTISANAILIGTPSSTFSVGGNWANSGTFTHNSGTITFTATTTGKTITIGGSNFNNITFNGSGGGWSFSGITDLTVNSLNIIAGTLTGVTGTTTVTGDWGNTGTYTAGASGTRTVQFTTASTHTINGTTTFHNLTFTEEGKTLLFEATKTTTIAGTITVGGATPTYVCALPVNLFSTINGTRWTLNVTGTASIQYAYVKDSDASVAITANNTFKSGTNANWQGTGCLPKTTNVLPSPLTGIVGSVVSFDGYDFDASSTATVQWGAKDSSTLNNTTATIKTDARGKFEADVAGYDRLNFFIPEDEAGVHKIAVTVPVGSSRPADKVSTAIDFTIVPWFWPSAFSAHVGDAITFIGNGYVCGGIAEVVRGGIGTGSTTDISIQGVDGCTGGGGGGEGVTVEEWEEVGDF